jgi:hypothetical protein
VLPIRPALVAAAAVLVAGCGGGGQDVEERDAAHARWAKQVDDACRKANEAIADRGWPRDLVDLDRLVVRAMPDVERALTTIQRAPKPDGSEERVGVFLKEVGGLRASVRELPQATGDMDPERLKDVAARLEGKLQNLAGEAQRAGLSQCFRHGEQLIVGDSVRATVFAQELARLEREIVRRSRKLDQPVDSPADLAELLDDFARTVDGIGEDFEELEPPGWATVQAREYGSAMDVLAAQSKEFAADVRRGVGPAEAKRLDTQWRGAVKDADKAYAKLVKRVGAAPAVPPGGGGGDSPAAPEEESA